MLTVEAMMAMAVERTATATETGKLPSVGMKFVELSVSRMVVVGRMAVLMKERTILVRKVKTAETCIFSGACRELRINGLARRLWLSCTVHCLARANEAMIELGSMALHYKLDFEMQCCSGGYPHSNGLKVGVTGLTTMWRMPQASRACKRTPLPNDFEHVGLCIQKLSGFLDLGA